MNKKNCIPVPIIPDIKPGDTVQVPNIGTFINATVTKVDKDIGRIFAERQIGSQTREMIVAFGDIMTELEL